MAYNSQEIELKLPLSKKQYLEIKSKLHKIAKFVKFSHHIDDYFTPTYKSFLDEKNPYEWLTVRKRDGITILNYKHWYPEGAKYTTHCDEYETEVASSEQLWRILKALKFKKFVTVEKKREVFLYKNSLEIALDEVKSLGYFIEVETIRDLGGVEKSRNEMLKFTKKLGLTRTKTVPGGYAFALLKKKGLVKR